MMDLWRSTSPGIVRARSSRSSSANTSAGSRDSTTRSSLYARGMTVSEIQAFLRETYTVDVSPDLISALTDAIVAELTAWQSRPIEPVYPVVFFDALRVKIRDEATVRSKAVYLALAVLPDGSRDILGIWIEQSEGAKFWMKVFTDLKTRGCRDILIAVTDGLKGMEEALRPCFRRRRYRPASCICCGRVWISRIGNSASRSPPRCEQSTRGFRNVLPET
jgi:hypothetical protein